jgi:hypothetical protein
MDDLGPIRDTGIRKNFTIRRMEFFAPTRYPVFLTVSWKGGISYAFSMHLTYVRSISIVVKTCPAARIVISSFDNRFIGCETFGGNTWEVNV